MAKYIVNKNAQPSGDHEVHVSNCDQGPNSENQLNLGEHANCHGAMTEAKKHFSDVDGCFYCCNPCHKT